MPLQRNERILVIARARELLRHTRLNIKAAIVLLNEMPDDMDCNTQTSVKSALNLVWAARKDRHHEAVARYALARVIVMLDRELANGMGGGETRSV